MSLDLAAVRAYSRLCYERLPRPLHTACENWRMRATSKPGLLLPFNERPGAAQLAAVHDNLHTRRAQLTQQLAEIVEVAASNEIDILIIKGRGVEAHYPSGLHRSSNDVDLVVSDHHALWRLAEALESRGYWAFGISLAATRWHEPANLHGAARFADPRESFPEVEISFGGFGECLLTSLPAAWLWRQSAVAEGSSSRIPDPVGALLVLLAEIYSRNSVRDRDLIDLYFIVRNLSAETVELVQASVREFAMCGILHQLAPGFSLNGSSTLVVEPTTVPNLGRSWLLRRNAGHVLPYLRRRVGVLRALALAASNCFDEWRNQEAINGRAKLVRLSRHLYSARKRLLQGRTLVLLSVASAVRGNLAWFEGGNQTYLRTPIGTYLVSKCQTLETEEELSCASEDCRISVERARPLESLLPFSTRHGIVT